MSHFQLHTLLLLLPLRLSFWLWSMRFFSAFIMNANRVLFNYCKNSLSCLQSARHPLPSWWQNTINNMYFEFTCSIRWMRNFIQWGHRFSIFFLFHRSIFCALYHSFIQHKAYTNITIRHHHRSITIANRNNSNGSNNNDKTTMMINFIKL